MNGKVLRDGRLPFWHWHKTAATTNLKIMIIPQMSDLTHINYVVTKWYPRFARHWTWHNSPLYRWRVDVCKQRIIFFTMRWFFWRQTCNYCIYFATFAQYHSTSSSRSMWFFRWVISYYVNVKVYFWKRKEVRIVMSGVLRDGQIWVEATPSIF